MPKMTPLPADYNQLLADVKERIRSAQYAALKAVNTELVGLYWDLGRMIVERQNQAGWGTSVVEQLSQDLRREFPGVTGFSVQNLWYMRQFYMEYREHEKLQPLVGEIAWAHNLAIMSKCKDPLEREFYLRMTRKFGWSKNVLIHQIDNQSYEKSLLGQTNFDQTLTPALRAQAKLAVKDEYTFDFLELDAAHSERELERALIAKIEDFLRHGGLVCLHGQPISAGGGRAGVLRGPAAVPPAPALSSGHRAEGGRFPTRVRRQDAVLSGDTGSTGTTSR